MTERSKFSVRYTPEKVAEMVALAQQLGSARKAAKELGVSYQTVLDRCHQHGISFVTVSQKSALLPCKIIDGFRFTKSKNFYRATTDNGRETISQYLYRKMHGIQKPKGICIGFKDGNNENYSLDNIEFITTSESSRRNEALRHESNVAILDAERRKYNELEKRKPHLMRRRMHRMMTSKRMNDPDNNFAIRGAETRRRNAEERGYWYTEEQRRHMSEAHKGKSRNTVKIRIHEDMKASIRRKMGIAI